MQQNPISQDELSGGVAQFGWMQDHYVIGTSTLQRAWCPTFVQILRICHCVTTNRWLLGWLRRVFLVESLRVGFGLMSADLWTKIKIHVSWAGPGWTARGTRGPVVQGTPGPPYDSGTSACDDTSYYDLEWLKIVQNGEKDHWPNVAASWILELDLLQLVTRTTSSK